MGVHALQLRLLTSVHYGSPICKVGILPVCLPGLFRENPRKPNPEKVRHPGDRNYCWSG